MAESTQNMANTMQALLERLRTLDVNDETIKDISADAQKQLETLRRPPGEDANAGAASLPRELGVEAFLKNMDELGSNNSFLWCIEYMRQRLEDSSTSLKLKSSTGVSRNSTCRNSLLMSNGHDYNPSLHPGPEFYLNPFGYRFQLRLYTGENSIGAFLKLIQGDYDTLLQWPFSKVIRISLISQVTKSKAPANPTPKKCNALKYKGNKTCVIKPKPSNAQERQQWMQPPPSSSTTGDISPTSPDTCSSTSQPSFAENRRWFGTNNLITKSELVGTDNCFISEYLRNDRIQILIELID